MRQASEEKLHLDSVFLLYFVLLLFMRSINGERERGEIIEILERLYTLHGVFHCSANPMSFFLFGHST